MLSTKLPGDIVARAIAEEEREGLYEKHHAKHYTYRSCGLCVDLPHKKSVDQVVHAGQQHRYDRRKSHSAYHTMDRRLGKK